MTDERRDWFFTFGTNHLHPDTGKNLGNSCVRVHGTFQSARAAIIDVFGTTWCGRYDSADEAGIERFGLTKIPLPDVPGNPVTSEPGGAA
jgi:hypothetical protein